MELVTKEVDPGDWVVIAGHNPADLGKHIIDIGGVEAPALFAGDQMMARCPKLEGRQAVLVDGQRVGIVRVL